MSFTQRERVEMEEALQATGVEVASSVLPRWQRKALQRQQSAASAARAVGTPKRATRTSTTTGKTPRQTPSADRFIPSRSAMDFDVSHFNLVDNSGAAASAAASSSASTSSSSAGDVEDSPARTVQRALASQLFTSGHAPSGGAGAGAGAGSAASGATDVVPGAAAASVAKVLTFRNKAPEPTAHQNHMRVLYSQNKSAAGQRRAKVHRVIPNDPERVLDAPDMVDDYYLNLLDWGSTNVLAVALGQTLYLWNATTGDIDELMTMPGEEDYITSVSWIKQANILGVGTSSGHTQLWDVNAGKQVRTMNGHAARVSALAWNAHILTSGGRDTAIVHHDVRQRDHKVATLQGHTQEVCGLKWSPDGSLLASGGNDNMACIWDVSTTTGARGSGTVNVYEPKHQLVGHQAAVKALAWCPFQRHVLATGGGTADRCIKFWNTTNGAMLNSIDTGSQVCSLLWSQHEREILSSHGYSQNQLCLWKYPSMAKVKELHGHSARVLHLAASPDLAHVCSAGADETLRFWNVFGEPRKASKSKSNPSSRMICGGKTMSIR